MSAPHTPLLWAGLWRENPALVQMLGLCPLLAATTTLVAGVSLGVVTTFVLIASCALVSLLARRIPTEMRLLSSILIIASAVTLAHLALNAYVYPLYLMLGIYVPLIATNCLILERAELFASRAPLWKAVVDAAMRGVGLTMVLTVLGAMRELLGKGTLFAGIEKVLGPSQQFQAMQILPHWYSFLLVSLPPGAFILLGLLVALRNRLARPAAASLPQSVAELPAPG
jgi:Na+-translocating ferredoxin:NAD+ oxidoreductase subunit E